MSDVADPQTANMKAKATIAFTLHVHLDDGTVKDIPCVGVVNPATTKEQDHDHLGS